MSKIFVITWWNDTLMSTQNEYFTHINSVRERWEMLAQDLAVDSRATMELKTVDVWTRDSWID